jgi:ATP-dependent helicase/nuclease subunit A
MSKSPQVRASDPAASVFLAANAGSGKTSTLVRRVARLLLRGARPEAILCVTYTKAAASEMQRRLFQELGDWAVMEDEALAAKLADLDEPAPRLDHARVLFARALETPGGIKIQTIHAFCEKLLKRFPLEAGVPVGFTVLDDAGAREVTERAREDLALLALDHPEGRVGEAYAYFSVELDHRSFNDLFAAFEAERSGVRAYAKACEEAGGGYGTDLWRRCGFAEPTSAAAIEAEAIAAIRWGRWRRAAEALLAGTEATDQPIGRAMLAAADGAPFSEIWKLFCRVDGAPRKRLGTSAVDPWARDWLELEQTRLNEACEAARAARIAEASVHAMTLALAYAALYEGAKQALSALDFGDLIERVGELLTQRSDAAWVLYKLDGGIDHLLLDEAQDTAPDQWDILRLITQEFFAGHGAARSSRTVFAVGDKKQSIFSFQGAAPERFAVEAERFGALAKDAGRTFDRPLLLENWRSAPEILAFVDEAFADPDAAAALTGADSAAFPTRHEPTCPEGGTVDLWPLEETEPWEAPDPWAPVDAEPPESAGKKLARRIAKAVKRMIDEGEGVRDRRTGSLRPARFGDVMILVRRRNALFHKIIRALKDAYVPVGGADRLKLSEHAAFLDLMALGRFARFVGDDLNLAALLRSPFCNVPEDFLFDLAHGRKRPLWRELSERAGERSEWGQALRFLDWARREAQRLSPFDFYGRVLARLDEDGVSMKRRLLSRLGREAEEAVEAFLAEALTAERRGVTDLELFLDEMAASEIEVKREQEDSEGRALGEVRVMTVHGAKGLEAPVVFLPDTSMRARAQGGGWFAGEGGAFFFSPRKAEDCPAVAGARAARERLADHESLRLLYVALTRARDRLIVGGIKTQDQHFAGSWRDVVERGFERPRVADGVRQVPLEGGGMSMRFGADPQRLGLATDASVPPAEPPSWALRPTPPEPAAAASRAPSRLGDAAPGPALSPLAGMGGLKRWRRGALIHRLLQLLPDVPPAARAAAAARLMAQERDLGEAQRSEMAEAALAVLQDPLFAPVFGPGSRAEVALAGSSSRLPPGFVVSGRVDRLVADERRVLVVDFKTNRPAPASLETADPAYLRQLAAYWAVLQEVFPGRAVEAALVWTDGPRLMPAPENLLIRALDELALAC